MTRSSGGGMVALLVMLALPHGCVAGTAEEPLIMDGSERGPELRARAETLVKEVQASLRGEGTELDCRPDPLGSVPPPSTLKYFLDLDPSAIEELGFFEKGTWAEITLMRGPQGHLFQLGIVVAENHCVSFELGLVVE